MPVWSLPDHYDLLGVPREQLDHSALEAKLRWAEHAIETTCANHDAI
jgi:hypothetical protein